MRGWSYRDRMACAGCGAALLADTKFCLQCGLPQRVTCASCGISLPTGSKFCGECGTAVDATPPAAASPAAPVVERRVVSVLFADLVGFTPLSENRDAEEVRELLSRYFTIARTIVARYGGTVEKFIGDAVMAVWGVPSSHGDDAERAVRAAFELTDAVAGLGADV